MAGDRHRRARADLARRPARARRSPRSCGARPARRRSPQRRSRTRLVYVSPLKALAYDVERNLRAPLRGIGADVTVGDPHRRHAAARARGDAPPPAGHPDHDARVALPDAHARRRARCSRRRGGDRRRDPRRRRDEARRAPRADARAARRAAADGATRSGSGLSATQNPLEEIGRFLVGPRRTCTIVDAGMRKPLDLKIHVPVESMVEPEQGTDARRPRPVAGRRGDAQLDLAGDLPRAAQARARAPLDDRLRQQPPRRRAPRAAPQRAANGARSDARSRAPTTARWRARSARRRGAAQGRRAAVPRRDVVARARHRHGRRRPRAAGRVAEVGPARAAADRPRRPRRRRHLQGPDLPEVPRRPARVRGRRPADARGPDRADRRAAQPARRARPADRRDRRRRPRGRAGQRRRPATRSSRARTPTPSCRAQLLENVLDMLDGRYPSEEFGELRPRIVWDRVAGTIRARKGAARARDHERRHDPRPRPVRRRTCPTGAASASSTRRWSTRRGRARRSCSARRRGGSRRSAATASSSRPRPGVAGRGPVLARRQRRPAEGARRGDRRVRAQGGRAGRRGARARLRPRPARRAEPARLPARAAGRDARDPVATARSSSSASATRSATGGCACSRRTAGASTPRGAWR